MATNPITPPLPADLPENWQNGQIVAPEGADVGLSTQHGYNYLMQQVNAAQDGVNTLGQSVEDLGSEIENLPTDGIMLSGGGGVSTLPASANWQSVTYGNDMFVAVSGGLIAAYSLNGINWIQTDLPANAGWRGVAYGNGMFVAVAGNNTDIIAYSPDGINWTRTAVPVQEPRFGITYGNGKFVSVPSGGNLAIYSTDGINWTQTTMPTSARWYSVTYGDGKFVVVGYSRNTAYSSDRLLDSALVALYNRIVAIESSLT